MLTHRVHVQRSPPRVGAVVLVVLTGRLGGRRRSGAPQTHVTAQYGLKRETETQPG